MILLRRLQEVCRLNRQWKFEIFRFPTGKQKVLKDVSLKIEEGKITTILGANGWWKIDTVFSMTKNKIFQKREIFFLNGKTF